MAEAQLDQVGSRREQQDQWEQNQQRITQETANILRNATSVNALLEPMIAVQALCFRALADGLEAMARNFGQQRMPGQYDERRQGQQGQGSQDRSSYGTSGQRFSQGG